jgi:large subunit ribosomal protein L15
MRLDYLITAAGSVKKPKRLGRGQGTGTSGTCTRGHKGAKSRSGNSNKLGFEGGQMPLQRRIPKFGFKNTQKHKYVVINLDMLQSLADRMKLKSDYVNKNLLLSHKMVKKNDRLKLLGRGKLKLNNLKIVAHKFSKTAVKAIKKVGGEIVTVTI